jgi:hypothetical protein
VYRIASQVIENNAIVGNTAGERGGGISILEDSNGLITGNTICKNSAAVGGGVRIQINCSATISNSILWENDAPTGPEMKIGTGAEPSTVTISYSDVDGGQASIDIGANCTLNWGPGMIDSDPLFADAANADYHLTWNSPCKDTGDNTAVTEPTDLEGDPRIAMDTVDMGSDEFYYHLYHRDDVIPGSSIEICVVGEPNDSVLLGTGVGIQDPPLSTQYGDLYIWPLAGQWNLPAIPGTGVLAYPATVPLSWNPGDEYPLQALVGPLGDPNSVLTNLMLLTVE